MQAQTINLSFNFSLQGQLLVMAVDHRNVKSSCQQSQNLYFLVQPTSHSLGACAACYMLMDRSQFKYWIFRQPSWQWWWWRWGWSRILNRRARTQCDTCASWEQSIPNNSNTQQHHNSHVPLTQKIDMTPKSGAQHVSMLTVFGRLLNRENQCSMLIHPANSNTNDQILKFSPKK